MYTVKEEGAHLASGMDDSRPAAEARAHELSVWCPKGVWLVIDDKGQRVAAFQNGSSVSVRDELSALRAIVALLPKCSRCGSLAVGEVASDIRVIGRKKYGGEWEPYCSSHPPSSDAAMTRLYPYHAAAEELCRVHGTK